MNAPAKLTAFAAAVAVLLVSLQLLTGAFNLVAGIHPTTAAGAAA